MSDSKVDDKTGKEPTLTEVLQGIRYIMGRVTAMEEREKAATQRLSSFEERLAKPKEDDKKPAAGPKDIDGLTNTELMDHMLGHIKTLLEPVTKKVAETEKATTRVGMKAELDELMRGEPDLVEYREDLQRVLEEVPGISLSRALAIAKREAPEKTERLEKKRSEAKAAKEREESERAAEDFGGFMPTSSRVSTPGDKKLSADEAAETAWQKVFGGTPMDREFNLDRSN